MKPNYFYCRVLSEATNALAYVISQELATQFPDKVFITDDDSSFAIEEYAEAGLCRLTPAPSILPHIVTEWQGSGEGLEDRIRQGWYEVAWREHRFTLVLATWYTEGCRSRYHWIVADSEAAAREFYETVCEWCAEVRGEVLVFHDGDWEKSDTLYQSIQTATLDNLILPCTLKRELQDDFAQFFQSRSVYERYRVPWKRGVLFLGPPGNGKTHAVKALINQLRQPCLYVKSFKARYSTPEENMRRVFKRARNTTPCLLILEDLDSLIDDKNRAFFLNEMDGFAANTGIMVIATTNHPERLDPALLERPSRFDRKYTFGLPAPTERHTYLARWNEEMEPDLRLAPQALEQVVTLTEDYSFAYLKELCVSSIMRWIASPEAGTMGSVMAAQARLLRQQMQTTVESAVSDITVEDDENEE